MHLAETTGKVSPPFRWFPFWHACGMGAFPTSNAVVNWLKGHTAGIGRIVEPDLKLENVPVFDLSVGSPELGNSLEPGDMAFTTQKLLSRMQAAHSPLGIARYIKTPIIPPTH